VNKSKKPLSETHPELAKEANGWSPDLFSHGSHKKLEWKCKKNHIWVTTIYSRTIGSNCPYCKGTKILEGFNDLATTHPELAKEAYGWDPTKFSKGSNKKLEWKCIRDHIWSAYLSNRTLHKSNCPVCSNQKVLEGFNDLATTHPDLAREAYGWDPRKIIGGTGKKLNWICPEGHVWKTTPNNRTTNNSGCPVCSHLVVSTGFNDLATSNPELAKEAYGWDPKTLLPYSNKKMEWICSREHKWKATVANRYGGRNCPYCSNKKVLSGFNDLATTHPELAKEAYGWDPKTLVYGSGKKVKWICDEGHIWTSSVSHRSNQRNCPSCSQTGFDPNQSGFLYFLIHPKWELFQIGITNFPEDRLKTHQKTGFELLELRGPMDGHTAQELELSLLRYLKNQKADLYPEHIAGKFDGYSESWTIDSFKVNNLKELIDKTSEAGF
jgi:hypothetical protein